MDHFSNKFNIDLSNDQNNSINDDAFSQTDVSNFSGDSFNSKKLDTNNILLYIENLVVKILIIIALLIRHHAHYAV